MRANILRRNITIIAVVSVVLAGLILLIMKLRFFDKVNADITAANNAYNTAAGTAKGLEAALTAQKIAENNLGYAREETNAFRQRFRSLQFNVSGTKGQRDVTFRNYLNEYYSDYGVELRKELIQAADESGVVVRTSVKVQAPPQNPEDVVTPTGGFLKPLTDQTMSIEAVGKLPNVIRYFNRINQSEILTTTGGGFRLENSNPNNVRVTFTLTPYLVASGPDALLPGGAAAATPGTGTSGVPGSPNPGGTSPPP